MVDAEFCRGRAREKHGHDGDEPPRGATPIDDKGYDPKFGARPLNRAIQKYIEDPIAEEILKAQVVHGDVIMADYEEGKEELVFAVTKSGEDQNLASDERPAEAPEAPDADAKK